MRISDCQEKKSTCGYYFEESWLKEMWDREKKGKIGLDEKLFAGGGP